MKTSRTKMKSREPTAVPTRIAALFGAKKQTNSMNNEELEEQRVKNPLNRIIIIIIIIIIPACFGGSYTYSACSILVQSCSEELLPHVKKFVDYFLPF